jgi:GT2 family glycosyltransferase
VGIATLDRPDQLTRCLKGLLDGVRPPDEVIVVDQGNDPRTLAAVELSRQSLPIRYIAQPRRGLSAARNAVIRAARCAIVAVTDDDCVPDSGWLRAVDAAFQFEPHPVAVSGRVLPLGPAVPGTFAVSLRTRQEPYDFVGEAEPWAVATGANFAARHDWLLRLGGYDERLGAGSRGFAAEDLELSFRFLKAGARIRYEPAAIIYHERQSQARRLATRWSYAHGIGALCGMLCRKGDRYGLVMLKRSLGEIAGRGLNGVAERDLLALRQAGLSLAGTLRGLTYGWRTGSTPWSIRVEAEADDEHPPAV